MYSFPCLQPVHCSMSCSNCCFSTCIQISQEAGQVVWYSHLLKNFPQFVVIHTVKGFGTVNEAEVDVCCQDREEKPNQTFFIHFGQDGFKKYHHLSCLSCSCNVSVTTTAIYWVMTCPDWWTWFHLTFTITLGARFYCYPCTLYPLLCRSGHQNSEIK